ncbi:MAG: pyruvate, phosphate dikinase [Thermanaerothrix sp.]|jgi:pyruvate,orthophosphate dikinase|uniref:Pyruvate, phosphate dikinase n=1 Tax=Thermanaerothrix solaris TaxID=3058434 RepID=A0ABU3NSQ0_9CHLR|nr:pyruvate, phosphate dikinase [Thermanaerothrix sp. 4228-RoL]MDT8899425.1 pyruvate, phosphate dikinase [Thermanaerothrix sp. 4228-RoL]
MKKWVYLFHELDEVEKYVGGNWDDVRGLLGGKGANLAEMTRLGVPVPPGFTVTTEACNAYLKAGGKFPEGLWEQMMTALAEVEKLTGKKFGGTENPLLVSCRSGAKFSMPGMMDTVLNIGLNDETAQAMIRLTNNPRFVYDAYRRLVQMFGSVVLGIPDEAFEEVLDEFKRARGAKADTDLTAEDLKELTEEFKKVVRKQKGFDFPTDPYEQLRLATEAVFKSWNGKRAVDYRRATGIPDDLGTAVNIVTMVFGNMGWDSGTGVAFTRDPSTGEKKLYGEYLLNAQGEDVVAGIRNTEKIENLAKQLPEAYQQFLEICEKLERHYRDMQDVEFTIERGRLWMLQTRNGKRTARAAVKIAVDMVNEGLITKEEAVLRVSPEQVDTLLHPQFDPKVIQEAKKEGRLFATGVNASPGAAVGQVYFDADTAERMAKEFKQDVIMVRPFTKPDDVHGMLAAKGILTSEGGATSHAAVVARQFGVPCVVGASSIQIDLDKRLMSANGVVVREGEWISLDGGTGEVFLGKLPMTAPSLEEQRDLMTLLEWADEICARPGIRKGPEGFPTTGLQVWANADYPKDARRARAYGAKGIGLCRTEHMFFEPERLPIVQRMILAKTSEERKQALDELLPFQRSDFEGLFEAMDGYPVIIRLIDPPLHEFLPSEKELQEQIITKRLQNLADYVLGKGESKDIAELEKILVAVEAMHESNPMMGLRGVRLSIVMPEIVEMQVRAIFEAAANVTLRGIKAKPEVMIPLTGHINELKWIQPRLEEIAKQVMKEKGVEFPYKFGTMIEVPRAAVTAGEIAQIAEFFSFGTNDLTQMTFGYSRDDAERSFLVKYVELGVLPKNPFQTLDREGVGRLMKMAIEEGRKTRPDLEVGICGEHGGDPSSIEFCHLVGNNYVSCSPFRVPVARLAAAHAALKHAAK